MITDEGVEVVIAYAARAREEHARLAQLLAGQIGISLCSREQGPVWVHLSQDDPRPPRLPVSSIEPFGGGFLSVGELDQLLVAAVFFSGRGLTESQLDEFGVWAQSARFRNALVELLLAGLVEVTEFKHGQPVFQAVKRVRQMDRAHADSTSAVAAGKGDFASQLGWLNMAIMRSSRNMIYLFRASDDNLYYCAECWRAMLQLAEKQGWQPTRRTSLMR